MNSMKKSMYLVMKVISFNGSSMKYFVIKETSVNMEWNRIPTIIEMNKAYVLRKFIILLMLQKKDVQRYVFFKLF